MVNITQNEFPIFDMRYIKRYLLQNEWSIDIVGYSKPCSNRTAYGLVYSSSVLAIIMFYFIRSCV